MQESTNQNFPLILIPLIPVFVVGNWCLITYLIAFCSGWRLLAKRFRIQGDFHGQKWSFQSASMRFGARYNNGLTVGADNTGLFIVPFVLFRIGHPALLIPWTEISVARTTQLFIFKYVDLHLGREENVPFRIRPSLASKIQAAAGAAWPGFNRMELPPQAIE